MADQSVTLTVNKGQDFLRTITMRDSAQATIDLTGYSVAGNIRRTYSDDYIVASFVCTILNQVTNEGQFTIALTDTVTAAIPVDPATDARRVPKSYIFDIVLTNPSGDKDRIIEGTIKVSPGAT